jgi:predicted phosphodiesterase
VLYSQKIAFIEDAFTDICYTLFFVNHSFSHPEGVEIMHDIEQFDRNHTQALRRLWFLGDVHGEFKHIAETLLTEEKPPGWLVFLGDIDIEHKPFREILEPLCRAFPLVQVAFVYGNHDADTYEHWNMLHDCGEAVALHGQVVDLDGIRVAGLGGNFMGRIWSPPSQASFRNKKLAMSRGPYQWRDGQRPNPSQHAAIYPDDVDALAAQQADILVTHEAPFPHPNGFEAINELARAMGVVRTFHGHQHDDRSEEYKLVQAEIGFNARGVGYCGITNGLGEIIRPGVPGW